MNRLFKFVNLLSRNSVPNFERWLTNNLLKSDLFHKTSHMINNYLKNFKRPY